MTFDEYKKKVQPGRRVFVLDNERKKYGTACMFYSGSGEEYAIKFDNETMPRLVLEGNVHLVRMEEAN